MPKGAALPKIQATREYGALVRLEGDSVEDCIALARHFAAETGAVYVPPFDDREVVAGQGTVGLELLEEAPEAEAVVVPVEGEGCCPEWRRPTPSPGRMEVGRMVRCGPG